jgi:REP element-mobilizing transposase RayT
MPRTLRLEAEGGLYHVINRGNYRRSVFAEAKTKAAFLHCLDEACKHTGWVVHAWCIMSNHYHLALETPRANLVDGMRWLQGTFATRFNRLRDERGHLFQGRYKSLVVDPAGLGGLCHYIHLNPVRARLCAPEELVKWQWTSMTWLMRPKARPKWYRPEAALEHAGQLADTSTGRRKYSDYLGWLADDEPARKALMFDRMSRGWIVGTKDFRQAMVKEHAQAAAALSRGDRVMEVIAEGTLQDELARWLRKVGQTREAIASEGKSAPWKLAVAAAMKAHTTATNRWLAENLAMGNLHEVSRKVQAWSRSPDPKLARAIGLAPSPKT